MLCLVTVHVPVLTCGSYSFSDALVKNVWYIIAAVATGIDFMFNLIPVGRYHSYINMMQFLYKTVNIA